MNYALGQDVLLLTNQFPLPKPQPPNHWLDFSINQISGSRARASEDEVKKTKTIYLKGIVSFICATPCCDKGLDGDTHLLQAA
ncbi:hypothetical protein J4Q44_G00318950 [Coregonus suidteri]|uniref:Uncharacterized protein n=1 Tax=Coregonus suidteri TaxID=861788 RepID=A0AAN8KTS6_9TELE